LGFSADLRLLFTATSKTTVDIQPEEILIGKPWIKNNSIRSIQSFNCTQMHDHGVKIARKGHY
jgi:hypothetical protein